jgi:hypothetical protein
MTSLILQIDVDVMLSIKDPVSFVFDIGPEKLEVSFEMNFQ